LWPPKVDPSSIELRLDRITKAKVWDIDCQGRFLLWQTKETIGPPEQDPRFICVIDGKSTRARAGLLVHLTAPTIHAGSSGNVALEICNLGPFTFGLRENDVIAPLTVASISSPPAKTHQEAGTSTLGQTHVEGRGRVCLGGIADLPR
jgi:dCTP deaminase